MYRSSIFAIFALPALAIVESIVNRAVEVSRYFADLLIGWTWTRDPAPLVGKQMAIKRHADIVRNQTRSSPRAFPSMGFYSAAVAA